MAKRIIRLTITNLKIFSATNIVKDNDKENWIYSHYGITFDSAGSWNFDNDVVRNVITFVVHNNSSSHADNLKINF